MTGHVLGLVDEEIRHMNKLQVKPALQFNLLKAITHSSRVFDLRSFREPRKFFSEIRKEHAIKNGVEFEAVSLVYSFTPKEEGFGISNLVIEAGRITNNMLDDGISGVCPILFVVPTFKKKEKADRPPPSPEKEHHGHPKSRIPLYRTFQRQG